MYDIRSEAIKTFIMSNDIKLPRFQRRQTWDAKKNFELCISVFKNYPIGVSILSLDRVKGKDVRWLLDGRQRKNALKQTFDDPENVYNWAQKFIKFKQNDQLAEVEVKFWEKINEFLESEPEDDDIKEKKNDDHSDDSDNEEIPEKENNLEPNEEQIHMEREESDGIGLLLELILICHNKTKRGSGFVSPFDFSRQIDSKMKLPYESNDGKRKLSSRRLKIFIDNYVQFCHDEGIEYSDEKSLIRFLDDQHSISPNSKLEGYIHQNWKNIQQRIDILQRVDALFISQKIGLIEVKDLTPADSQKIFNLINSQGSPLKAVEILSARPKWNVVIQSPSAEVRKLVEDLYKNQMGITPDSVVRWDLAATFLRRIKNNFIFKSFSEDSKELGKELTIAFKCLSGIFVKGVTKVDIDKLADHPINWETEIDQLVYDINNMLGVLGSFPYFHFFQSWNSTIQGMTSDAIALDFLILSYNEWKQQGKPIGNNSATKIFQKYCFKLWDRLVYEYISSQWKGSGDSRIHKDIVDTKPLMPLEMGTWEKLIEEIYLTNKINKYSVPYQYMTPILYHTYSLLEKTPPATDCTYDIDHIIPQAIIKTSEIPNNDEVQDNLFNLALLPKKQNVAKGSKKLIHIDDAWLKKQIKDYEFIDEEDYVRFSDVSNYKLLFEHRKKFFLEAFKEKRTYLLNN